MHLDGADPCCQRATGRHTRQELRFVKIDACRFQLHLAAGTKGCILGNLDIAAGLQDQRFLAIEGRILLNFHRPVDGPGAQGLAGRHRAAKHQLAIGGYLKIAGGCGRAFRSTHTDAVFRADQLDAPGIHAAKRGGINGKFRFVRRRPGLAATERLA